MIMGMSFVRSSVESVECDGDGGSPQTVAYQSTKVRCDLDLIKRNVTHEPQHVTFVNRPQIDWDFSREIVS